MAHSHDDAVIGLRRHLKAGRNRGRVDGERVVTRCLKRRIESGEHALTGVMHEAGLAVHQFWRTHHAGSVHMTNALVAKTHAEHRNTLSRERWDRRTQNAGVFGSTRTGRQQHSVGL